MTRRARVQVVFVMLCLGILAAISLRATTVGGRSQSGDLVKELYSRLSASASETGHSQLGQSEERRRDNNIGTSLDLPSNVSDLYARLVVVTAYSSNHFEEGKGIIASVQKYMPHTKILLYDIGMTAEQRSNASKFCNVELRTFQFDKYPEHVQTLGKYAWKPIIIKEVSQEYDVIMYGDASLRVTSPHIEKALTCLLDDPFLDARPIPMPIISLTHNATIDYLHFPPSRQHMAQWGTVQAGCWLMLANDIMKQNVIQPWADCALHSECIAPAEVTTGNCHLEDWKKYTDGSFIGCHRFDQSALNIILAKEFGVPFFKTLWNKRECYRVWKIQRKSSDTLHVRSCTQQDKL